MDYILTVLSSGRPVYLERTLAAYAQHLSPSPSYVYVYDDGSRLTIPVSEMSEASGWECDWRIEGELKRLGQCAAQARCWQAAADSEYEWAFHVEDDVVLLRPLDMNDLVQVLEAESHVCQMALVRCPWGAEVEFGGYIPMMPGHYERRHTLLPATSDRTGRKLDWIATRRNWANAPALFRTSFARDLAWPAEPGCETTVGPMIFERWPDAEFGLYGAGEPWCSHIGIERAPGSWGY